LPILGRTSRKQIRKYFRQKKKNKTKEEKMTKADSKGFFFSIIDNIRRKKEIESNFN
jgi:hypothetical protein